MEQAANEEIDAKRHNFLFNFCSDYEGIFFKLLFLKHAAYILFF